VRILRSGQRRGITRTLRAIICRRCAIEPAIGHMKMDGRLGCNPLTGAPGDALHAVMRGAGDNLRLIVAALRLYGARFGRSMQSVIAALIPAPHTHRPACGCKWNCSGRTIFETALQVSLVWCPEDPGRRASRF